MTRPGVVELGPHAGLAVSGLLTCVVALRLMGVSGGDPQTAWAILRETGTGSILVAFTVSALTIGAIGVTFLALTAWATREAWPLGPVPYHWTLIPAGVLLSLMVCDLTTLTVVLAGSAVVVGLTRIALPLVARRREAPGRHGDRPAPGAPSRPPAEQDEEQGPSTLERFVTRLFLVTITGFAAMVALVSPIWLPAEELRLSPDPDRIVYVLRETERELVVLDHRSGLVDRIPVDAVADRHICRPSPSPWRTTPLRALSSRAEYPPCGP